MSQKSDSKPDGIDLSIIIVNWNTKELTVQCLRSIVDNLSAPALHYEIIVVDNASSDSSVEAISESFSLVRLICNEDNAGYVKANNQGAELAKGRYLLLLNSDTQLLDDTMPSIIEYMDKHPRVGIATGKVLNPDRSFQPPYRRFPKLIDAYLNHTVNKVARLNTPFLRRHKYEELDPKQSHEVDSVTGAYLFIRRNLITENKIFDEDIFMYYEDTLLCKQVRKKGFQVMYLPVAAIMHYHGSSARKARPDAIYNSYLGSAIYINKVYGKKLAARYRTIVRITWHVLAFGFGILCHMPYPKFREKADLFKCLLIKSM